MSAVATLHLSFTPHTTSVKTKTERYWFRKQNTSNMKSFLAYFIVVSFLTAVVAAIVYTIGPFGCAVLGYLFIIILFCKSFKYQDEDY
jgi:Flp pilus assembly protein TadB